MKSLLGIALLVCVSIVGNAQNTSFTNHLKSVKNDRDLRNGIAGIYAIDLETNKVLGELNADICLRPASTLKLVTTAAALEILGRESRFKTELYIKGKIDTTRRTLKGDIYIKGYGDPTLGSRHFDDSMSFWDQWIAEIKKLGIDTIDGSVVGDGSFFSYDIVPPTWSWEDIGNYFGAGASGLCINDNSYALYFTTSSKSGGITQITKIDPEIPGLTIDNKVRSANISSDKSYIFGAPYTYHRYIRGYLPRGRTNYIVRGSLPDPELFAAQYFTRLLLQNNIVVRKEAQCNRILNDSSYIGQSCLIATKYSPTIAEIVYQINKKSINLFAENLLVHIGKTLVGVDDTKSATEILTNYWAEKGMDTNGISINDGSGLSQYNAISARQMVWLLEYMYKKAPKANFESFFNSLAIAGKDGTLKGVGNGTDIEGNVFAKSGSIRKVRCYAGYAKTKSGKIVAFAFMLNNYTCSDRNARKKLQDMMIALVNDL